TPALDLLLNLHKSLFVGFPGRVLVSLFGVSLLLLCLAGVLLHSRRWRDLRRWRRDRGLRLALFDLHGLIGIWGLPWLLLFGFTGALSGLGRARDLCCWRRVAYPQEPNRGVRRVDGTAAARRRGAAIGVPHRSRPPACRRCRAGARLRRPALEPQSCRGCRRQRGDRRYPAWPAEYRELRAAPLSAGRRRPARRAQLGAARVLAARLHRRAAVAFRPSTSGSGRAGPPRCAGLHLAMGLGACLLCASGLYLWLQRRASAPDARVRLLQRLSQGFCAGLVAAAALLLLGLQLVPSELLAGPWPGRLFLVLWAAAGLAALLLPGDWPLARGLLGVAGLACLAAAVAHLAPWLMRGRLPALGPDLTLILCGALLIRHAWTQARSAAPPAHPRVTGDHHA
ncbi:hypothetical protein PACG_03131, partial [Pseudomonas aeruginosa C3719]